MLGINNGFNAYDVVGMNESDFNYIPKPIIGVIALYNTKVIYF